MALRAPCLLKVDLFCYICGLYTPKAYRRPLTEAVCTAYAYYFGRNVTSQDQFWAPHFCCVNCAVYLSEWINGKKPAMPFGIPMRWSKPSNHREDCYFCGTSIKGLNFRSRNNIEYANVASAQKTIKHSEDIPVPNRLLNQDSVTNHNYTVWRITY